MTTKTCRSEPVTKVVIKLPCPPPSSNQAYKNTGNRKNPRVLAEDHKKFRLIVASVVRGQKLPSDWKFAKLDIYVCLHHNKATGDADNRIKPAQDALQKSGFIKNDKIIVDPSCHWLESDDTGKGSSYFVLTKVDRKFMTEKELLKELFPYRNEMLVIK